MDRLGSRGRRLALLLGFLLLAGTIAGGAFGYLTVSATAGSSGGAVGGTVNRVTGLALGGVTPTANHDVQLAWNPATLANSGAVSGYVVHRYDGANALQATGVGCSGVPASTGCTESAVPDGTWAYGVQAKFNNWLGSESNRVSVQVDTSAPAIGAHPAAISAATTPSFGFSHPTYASFKCKFDAGAYAACSSPQPASSLADGSHTFTVEAVDGAGFATQTASYTWSVDTSAPTISAKPAAASANTAPTFSFGHASYGSFECRLDSAAFSACTTPTSYTGLADGSHTFRVRAKDADGVVTATAAYTWTVDTSSPSITAKPAATSASNAPSFVFSQGSYSSFECNLDGGGYTACASPKSYGSLADGLHTLQIRAKDADGIATSSIGYSWTINTTAPAITAKPALKSANASPSFSFTHGASAYTFTCKLDGGSFAACSSPKAYGSLGEGPHTFQVEGVDADGVVTTAASYSWTVNTAAPTISAKPSSPSANAAPSFSFSHAAAVYTFACQLDGGGFTACAGPKSYGSLADGSHTFQVEGVDADGVVTAAASYTWTVNAAAPTLTAQPANPTSQTSATFGFNDGTYSLFTCKLDSGSAAACNSGTVSYAGPLAAGSHTFTVFATDADGAATQTRSFTWTVVVNPPVLQTLQMFDNDHNGKVDHVVATFDKTLGSCAAPCTSGWTLANVPSSGTLSSVTISGSVATLNLAEGTGAPNTAVGSFTVALANTSGIVDTTGNHASFAAQSPADKAPPVPIALALGDGNGQAAVGDTAAITFSEPLAVASICSTWSGDTTSQQVAGNGNVATITDNGASNDTLSSIVTAAGNCANVVHLGVVDLGSPGWVTATATFAGNGKNNRTLVEWSPTTSTLTITLGNLATGTVGTVSGAVTATYTPDAGLTDVAGNAAAGSISAGTKF